MQITVAIDSTTTLEQLGAISALIESLAGRRISAPVVTEVESPVAVLPPPPPPPIPTMPPPPPPIPTMPPPPPPVAADDDDGPADASVSADKRDSAGHLWDARIHAGTKAILADGTWRQKRGVSPELLAQAAAERTGPLAEPAATESPAAAATTAASVPPPPPPVVADPKAEFHRLIRDVNEKGLSYNELNAKAVEIGLEKMSDLLGQFDLIPMFRQSIGLAA